MLKKLTRDARLEHRGKDKGSSRGGQGQTMWDCACQSSRSEEQWKCVNGRGGHVQIYIMKVTQSPWLLSGSWGEFRRPFGGWSR